MQITSLLPNTSAYTYAHQFMLTCVHVYMCVFMPKCVRKNVSVLYAVCHLDYIIIAYRINSMYWDRGVLANSADQDRTASSEDLFILKKRSDQGLRCLPFHQRLLRALVQCCVKRSYF